MNKQVLLTLGFIFIFLFVTIGISLNTRVPIQFPADSLTTLTPNLNQPGTTPTITIPEEKNVKAPEKKAETPRELPGEFNENTINPSNVVIGLNQIRYNLNLPLLKIDPNLNKVAEKRLNDMITYKYFNHVNPVTGDHSYSDVFWAADAPNYSWRGEILASGFKTIQDTIKAWVESPRHYSFISDKKYLHLGIAFADKAMLCESPNATEKICRQYINIVVVSLSN